MAPSNIIHKILTSLPGNFFIGGFTVAAIAYFSNHLDNVALAGLIAAMPIGMPSSIFVDDNKVKEYSKNLLLMSFLLMFATTENWFFLNYTNIGKYKSVAISLSSFWILGLLYIFFVKRKTKKN